MHTLHTLFQQILPWELASDLLFLFVLLRHHVPQAEKNHLGIAFSHCCQKCALVRFGKNHKLLSGTLNY